MRLLGIADRPGDTDDERLRKRAGVSAGYITIVAPLLVPIQAQGHLVALILGVGWSAYSAVDLLVLARTRRFEPYVVALLVSGVVFVPAVTALGGGVTGATTGIGWAFLVPAYAIMALGPRRATVWFVAFLGDGNGHDRGRPVPPRRHPGGTLSLAARCADRQHRSPLEHRLPPPALHRPPPASGGGPGRELRPTRSPRPLPPGCGTAKTGSRRRTRDHDPVRGHRRVDSVGAPDRCLTVVALLDRLFTRFDQLADRPARWRRIKTIGDAYMAGGRVHPFPWPITPVPRCASHGHPRVVANERETGGIGLQVRIGLASGPVVGGVIGEQRAAFDLWGERLTSPRGWSQGVPGRIQVGGLRPGQLPRDAVRRAT